ncbi:hypothetical protein PS838_05055 [Pseudomonas fluorescens]|nr:hypothetical protein PS838_05055 [Pseudomonas fluorescens]
MSILRRWCSLGILLLPGYLWISSVCAQPQLQPQPQNLNLLGRSNAEGQVVKLSETDSRWLRQKGRLVLAVSAPDYPPFDITTTGTDYEGLTADYAGLLQQLLNVAIDVQRYPSREDAVRAIKQGSADLLGTANSYEAENTALRMSSAYAVDQPVLVTRTESSQLLDPDLAGKRLATLYHYLPEHRVQAFYPQASVQLFPSTLSAVGAVAFQQADVYLGDAISAHYLISKNYLNNVQLADFSSMESGRFAFALARDNQPLHRIVNSALAAVSTNEHMNILRRWGANGTSMPGTQALQLSEAEQRWLDRHPRATVAMNENTCRFRLSTAMASSAASVLMYWTKSVCAPACSSIYGQPDLSPTCWSRSRPERSIWWRGSAPVSNVRPGCASLAHSSPARMCW